MSDDRALLEAAAKAAGYWSDEFNCPDNVPRAGAWDPLTDDGDALRLAVKLAFINPGCWPNPGHEMELLIAEGKPDWNVATRRAIVRAAASMAPKETP
jgi:hypothetical protein